jgi:hypothetical protein
MAAPKSTPEALGAQLSALLAGWESSLSLHAKYARLDHERYWHVQPWPKHERPAEWIIALARQRVSALQRIVEQRRAEGDRAFIEALEMMTFLANLVGLKTVERFIPLATPELERREVLAAPKPAATPKPVTPQKTAATKATASTGATSNKLKRSEEATREMPKLAPGKVQRMLLEQRAGVSTKTLAAARAAQATSHAQAKRRPERAAKPGASSVGEANTLEPHELLVAEDAIRLLGWGRKWHELGELIPRLAGRPSPSETRRILRQHRAQIETRFSAPTN